MSKSKPQADPTPDSVVKEYLAAFKLGAAPRKPIPAVEKEIVGTDRKYYKSLRKMAVAGKLVDNWKTDGELILGYFRIGGRVASEMARQRGQPGIEMKVFKMAQRMVEKYAEEEGKCAAGLAKGLQPRKRYCDPNA